VTKLPGSGCIESSLPKRACMFFPYTTTSPFEVSTWASAVCLAMTACRYVRQRSAGPVQSSSAACRCACASSTLRVTVSLKGASAGESKLKLPIGERVAHCLPHCCRVPGRLSARPAARTRRTPPPVRSPTLAHPVAGLQQVGVPVLDIALPHAVQQQRHASCTFLREPKPAASRHARSVRARSSCRVRYGSARRSSLRRPTQHSRDCCWLENVPPRATHQAGLG
jgi:hypothetical protein